MNRLSKKENSNKVKIIKTILIIILILILVLAIKTGISIASWQNMAQDMISNSSSEVFDTDRKSNCRTWKQ